MSPHTLEIRLRVPLEPFTLTLEHRTGHRVLGIFGPSGSGKTTCVEALAGIRAARGFIACEGEVWLDSSRGIDLPPERRRVGYVPQDHLLFPHLDVRRNLTFGRTAARTRRLDEVIAVLELAPLLARRPHQLSGGERQRVALGRALCSGPRLLLLDEPLASLDLALRRRILPFLLRVKTAFDLPMVIISHQPVEVQALCDEVLVLRSGELVAAGPPVATLTRPTIYAAAAAERFETVLPARLTASASHTATVELGDDPGGPSLTILPPGSREGQTLAVGLPAADILLATQRPQGLSARNILPATIERIETVGEQVLVSAKLDRAAAPPVVVELTPDARDALRLQAGQAIWLVIKTSAVTVYG